MVVALVAAVAVALAVKNKAPDSETRPAEDSGISAPVGDRAAEQPAPPTEAAKPDSKTVVDKREAASETNAAPKLGNEARKPKAKPAVKPQQAKKRLPRLVDLGATKCVPCKMMAPILEEMKKDYKGKLEVVFIDVWENRSESEKYGIQSIPTQIFYGEDGKEFFRHEGFFPKEDILKTFRERGIKL